MIRHKKILLIDEDSQGFELLAAVMGSEGYIIELITTEGKEVLHKVKSIIPDLILLNIIMPEMNGYRFCETIRADSSLPYIPIIFFTTIKINKEEVIRGLEVGGDDYVQKPFDYVELLCKIKVTLRVKSLYDELIRMKAELARYVSLPTLQMIEKKGNREVVRTPEIEEVTVLFSDVRNFTNIASRMSPTEVFKMLNYLLSKQIKIVGDCHGMIDKLSGDEIMAIFEGPEMVQNALQCGKTICKNFEDSKNYSSATNSIGVGIGINTGLVHIGSIGSQTLRKYTVIGHTVNIAARLCGIAKKSQILFTESTKKLIATKDFDYKSIGKVPLKGMPVPTELFELVWVQTHR